MKAVEAKVKQLKIGAGPMMEGMGMKHDQECSKTEQ